MCCIAHSGVLRQPGGPRHDNDHADYRKVSIAPTQQQVLCDIPPFLPRNRWAQQCCHPMAPCGTRCIMLFLHLKQRSLHHAYAAMTVESSQLTNCQLLITWGTSVRRSGTLNSVQPCVVELSSAGHPVGVVRSYTERARIQKAGPGPASVCMLTVTRLSLSAGGRQWLSMPGGSLMAEDLSTLQQHQ